MNTILKNVDFSLEVKAFMSPKLPHTPLPILHAMADSFRNHKHEPEWIHSNETKAMMHTLNMMVYGQRYQIDGQMEQARLLRLFGK